MNLRDRADLAAIVTGYWTVSDQRATALVKWCDERGITVSQARAAFADLAEQFDQAPSIKQLSVKLRELGTATKDPLGVGARGVIERMKGRIMEFAPPAAEREGADLRDRLIRERAQAAYEIEDARMMGVEESVRYWHDMVAAYDELLEPKRDTGIPARALSGEIAALADGIGSES